jgi:hypothetical protein
MNSKYIQLCTMNHISATTVAVAAVVTLDRSDYRRVNSIPHDRMESESWAYDDW